MHELARVFVREVVAEQDDRELSDVPFHLLGEPGTIAIQLRTTLHRVTIGAGLGRNQPLVDEIRSLPRLPGLVVSAVGGTFIMGGTGWLGLAAIGRPPGDVGTALDWMAQSLYRWFDV